MTKSLHLENKVSVNVIEEVDERTKHDLKPVSVKLKNLSLDDIQEINKVIPS